MLRYLPRVILILIALTSAVAATRAPPAPSGPATQPPAPSKSSSPVPGQSSSPAPSFPSADIDRALGATGAWDAAKQVYKVTFPRTDIPVQVDGPVLPPFMGLTSWVAFQAAGGGQAMMMGDLVLFQDEVNPALDALLAGDAQVTA